MATDPLEIETDDNDSDESSTISPGPGRASREMASYWKDEINKVHEVQKKWIKRGNEIVSRFRDERTAANESGLRRMNVIWANFKILKPALYGKSPTLIIERTFLNKDPVGRLSSMMLERAGRNEIRYNGYDRVMSRCVDDYLLPGRGAAWWRYEPKTGKSASIPHSESTSLDDGYDEISKKTDDKGLAESTETDENEKLEDTGSIIVGESIIVDYVDWHDLIPIPSTARTWDEVQAIAKRFRITRHEAKERFGEEIGEAVPFDTRVDSDTRIPKQADGHVFRDSRDRDISGYEIWSKTDRNVYFITDGYEYLCDVKEDPLELDNFFPMCEPLSSTITNDNMVPVPDYTEWQDQAIQLDELTQRIAMITKACKVAGVYNASQPSIARIMNETTENQLIPVDDWVSFAERGGLKSALDFVPIEQLQKVLETLTNMRQQILQDLDLISGVSDVMRGTTDSRETLGGIRLKNNNTGTRLSERQQEVSRFCTDNLAIMVEMMAKCFSRDTLMELSGIEFVDELDPATIEEQLIDAKQTLAAMAPKPPQMPPGMPQAPQQPPIAPQSPNGQQQPPMGGNVLPFNKPPTQMGQGVMPSPQPPMGGPQQPPTSEADIPPPPNAVMIKLPRSIVAMRLGCEKDDVAFKLWSMTPETVIEYRVDEAIKLIKSDVPRRYRIEVETDSMIFGDRAQERDDVSEFVESITKFMAGTAQLVEQEPEVVPLLGKMLQFAVRKFRTGRDLESSVDDFVASMERKVKERAKNPQPNPEVMKQQMEMQRTQMEIQAQRENDQRDAQRQQMDDQREMQKNQMEDQRYQRESQMDAQMAQQKHQLEIQKMQMEMELKVMEHKLKLQELQMKHHTAVQQTQVKAQVAERQHQMGMVEHQQTMEQSQQQHEQSLQQGEMQHQHAQVAHKQKMQHNQKQQQMKQQANKPKPKAAGK
jgi:hypothetical protein